MSISDLLRAIPLPTSSYIVDTKMRSYEDSLRLMAMADVLLHPSKAEGFGMPVLESQLVGTPVITTRWRAMADYTMYGLSVPPLQQHWMHYGFVAEPSLSENVKALHDVYQGLPAENNRSYAQQWLHEHLSCDKVVESFDALLHELAPNDSRHRRPFRAQTALTSVNLGTASPISFGGSTADKGMADTRSLDNLVDIVYIEDGADHLVNARKHKWTLVLSKEFEVDPPAASKVIDLFQIGDGASPSASRQTKEVKADVVFLVAIRADGSSFPTESEVQSGQLHPDAALLIRTTVLVRSLRVVLFQLSSMPTASGATARQRLRAAIMNALSGAAHSHLQMQMFNEPCLRPKSLPQGKLLQHVHAVHKVEL